MYESKKLSNDSIREYARSLKALYEMYVGKEDNLSSLELMHLNTKQFFLMMEMNLAIMGHVSATVGENK